MLEIIEYGKDEYAFPSLLVLGCFDAIHVGHRELFKKARLQAKINGLDLGVMMFRDGKGGRQVYSFEERVAMLSAYNVKFVLVIDFTPEFKQIAPLDFLAGIEEKINVKAYMSGKDFRFGKGAKGKSSTLKNFAEDEENGVWYMPVKDVAVDGEKVSTTLVKSCLDSGDVIKAARLLGENYFVEGEVVPGEHRGSGVLGFPTVNINYPDWKYPVKQGVYKVEVEIDGATYPGIANYGGRPTFGDNRVVLEVHISGIDGDLYGKKVKVSFVAYMRDIVAFASPEELSARLALDKAALSLTDEQFAAAYPVTDLSAPEVVEEVTEEPAPEAAEEVTAEPAPEAAEEVTAEPAPEVAEEITEEPAPEAVEEAAEESAPEVVEEVTEEPAPEVAEEATEELAPAIVEEVAEEPAPEAIEEVTEEPASAVAEEVAEEPAPEVAEEVAEEPSPEVVEEAAEEPAPEVVEEVTEEPAPAAAEEAAEEPAPEAAEEATEETPVEEQTPTEEETPAEEEAPAEEETPAEEEAPIDEEIPAEEETPAEEEAPIEEETPAEEETPVEEEVPVEEVAPAEEVEPEEALEEPEAEDGEEKND